MSNNISKNQIKLQAFVTLDQISASAFDRMLREQDSFIRNSENEIANVIQDYTNRVSNPQHDVSNEIEDFIGKVLDVTNEMNLKCFKSGLQSGGMIMLEMLGVL